MEPNNDYTKKAREERNRQRGIAKSYLRSTPSINNLYNAFLAYWNSLPINTNSMTVNPYVQTGIAPSPGKIRKINIPKIKNSNRFRNFMRKAEEEEAITLNIKEQYEFLNSPDFLRYYFKEDGGLSTELLNRGKFLDDEWFWYKYADTDPGVWRINNYNRLLRGLDPEPF